MSQMYPSLPSIALSTFQRVGYCNRRLIWWNSLKSSKRISVWGSSREDKAYNWSFLLCFLPGPAVNSQILTLSTWTSNLSIVLQANKPQFSGKIDKIFWRSGISSEMSSWPQKIHCFWNERISTQKILSLKRKKLKIFGSHHHLSSLATLSNPCRSDWAYRTVRIHNLPSWSCGALQKLPLISNIMLDCPEDCLPQTSQQQPTNSSPCNSGITLGNAVSNC